MRCLLRLSISPMTHLTWNLQQQVRDETLISVGVTIYAPGDLRQIRKQYVSHWCARRCILYYFVWRVDHKETCVRYYSYYSQTVKFTFLDTLNADLWGLEESNDSLPPGDDLESPAGWLPVHRDQLRAQRSVTSMGELYLFYVNCKVCQKAHIQGLKEFLVDKTGTDIPLHLVVMVTRWNSWYRTVSAEL